MLNRFVVGDRVRIVEPDGATDQLGTVIRISPMPGVYAVQFDGEPQHCIMSGSMLTSVSGDTPGVQGTMTFQTD